MFSEVFKENAVAMFMPKRSNSSLATFMATGLDILRNRIMTLVKDVDAWTFSELHMQILQYMMLNTLSNFEYVVPEYRGYEKTSLEAVGVRRRLGLRIRLGIQAYT